MMHKLPKRRKSTRKHFLKSSISEAVSAAIIATFVATPVFGEEIEDDPRDNVIIVTATKSDETLQTVPLAMTALTGDFMKDVHLVDVMDIVAFTPGVNGASQNSFLDSINVRGIRTQDYGSGGDPSLGFFKNDLYEGRTGAAISTLFDMNRAEIINGPQGFLFGRNAIGGAISVHTNQAELDHSESSVDLDLGENSLIKINAMINLPVSENVAMRFAVVSHNEASHIQNVNPDDPIQDTDVKAIRWSTTYEKDSLRVTTMVEYEDRAYPAGLYRFIEEGELWEGYDAVWAGNRGDDYNIDTNAHWGLRDEAKVLNLNFKVEQEFDFADMIINAGYKDHDYLYAEQWLPSPVDNGGWRVAQAGDYSQAEIRFHSKEDDGPLSWYVGASFYKEEFTNNTFNVMSDQWMCDYYSAYYGFDRTNVDTCQNFHDNLESYLGYEGAALSYYPNLLNNPASDLVYENSYAGASNDGWGVYVNLDYQLTDTINVEFGMRYNEDNKEYRNAQTTTGYSTIQTWNIGGTTAPGPNGELMPIITAKSWDQTTYKYLVRWQPTDEMMLYASFTEGYKAGGFDSHDFEARGGGDLDSNLDLTNATAQAVGFDPEYVDSIELGYKDTWFENTDVRITYYNYDYSGLQIAERLEGGQTIISNLGSTKASGIEAALNTDLGDNWSLMMNYHYIDSEIVGVTAGNCGGVEGGCEGNQIPWTPEKSGSLVLNGFFPMGGGDAITVSLESYWESEHSGGFLFDPIWRIEESQTWSARSGYETDSWYVEAYVDNLTDEANYDSSYGGGANYPATHWATWKPRTFGIRGGMTFQ